MDDDSLMMDGQLAKNGLAMERWTARRCCDGQLGDGQLGNGWLGNGVMDGSRHVAAFLL